MRPPCYGWARWPQLAAAGAPARGSAGGRSGCGCTGTEPRTAGEGELLDALAEAQGGLARTREPVLETHAPETAQEAATAEDIRRASERLAEAHHPGRNVEPALAGAAAEVRAALQLHEGVWTGEAIR